MECKACNICFEPRYKQQKYCSKECREKYYQSDEWKWHTFCVSRKIDIPFEQWQYLDNSPCFICGAHEEKHYIVKMDVGLRSLCCYCFVLSNNMFLLPDLNKLHSKIDKILTLCGNRSMKGV